MLPFKKLSIIASSKNQIDNPFKPNKTSKKILFESGYTNINYTLS